MLSLAAALVLVLVPTCSALGWLAWRSSRVPCVLMAVTINTNIKDGTAFDAVIWAQRGRWLTLRDVTLYLDGHHPKVLDSEVVISLDNVTFIQRRRG